jgi:cytochrome c-type biogenesis protein CcmF
MADSDIVGTAGLAGLAVSFLCCLVAGLISVKQLIAKTSSNPLIFIKLIRVQTFGLGLAVLCFGLALETDRFDFTQVYESSELGMAWYEKIGGLWAGQAASILFWCFVFSFFILLALGLTGKVAPPFSVPALVLALEFLLLFFLIPSLLAINPFQKTWILPDGTSVNAIFAPINAVLFRPEDGLGLNPSLRHLAMIVHPPFIYAGLTSLFLPFVFCAASLIEGAVNDAWIKVIYPLVLISWVLLTIGIALGSWWAYTILGWGGYWGWDAVEISGLLPWLLSIALIHSIKMHLRGFPFKKWIFLIAGMAAWVVLFGILLTRSGIIDSVHAYSQGIMGPFLTGLILVMVLTYSVLMVRKWGGIQNDSQPGKSLQFYFAVIFNIMMMILALVIFYGQTLPLTSSLFSGQKIYFSPKEYEAVAAPPVFLLILCSACVQIIPYAAGSRKKALAIVAILLLFSLLIPLLVLAKTHASFSIGVGYWVVSCLVISVAYTAWNKNPFLLGNTTVKIGISRWQRLAELIRLTGFIVLFTGILSVENFSSKKVIQLSVGEATPLFSGTIALDSQTYQVEENGYAVLETQISYFGENKSSFLLKPAVEYFPKTNALYSKPDQNSTLLEDIQLVIYQVPKTLDDRITLQIYRFPLMAWIWIGCALLVAGGLGAALTAWRYLYHVKGRSEREYSSLNLL